MDRNRLRLLKLIIPMIICFSFGKQTLPAQQEEMTRQIETFHCIGSKTVVLAPQFDEAFQSVFASLEDIARRLSLPPMRDHITIRVFENDNTWRQLLQKEGLGNAYRRSFFLNNKAIVLKSQDPYPVIYILFSPKFDEDLRHEVIHAYLQSVFKRTVPLWLDEGLAEYYENVTNRIYNDSWFDRTCARIENNSIKSLKQLEAMVDPGRMTNNEYSDSWAWVCFLLHGSEAYHATLVQYTHDLTSKKLFYSSLTKMLAKKRLDSTQDFVKWYEQLKAHRDAM